MNFLPSNSMPRLQHFGLLMPGHLNGTPSLILILSMRSVGQLERSTRLSVLVSFIIDPLLKPST